MRLVARTFSMHWKVVFQWTPSDWTVCLDDEAADGGRVVVLRHKMTAVYLAAQERDGSTVWVFDTDSLDRLVERVPVVEIFSATHSCVACRDRVDDSVVLSDIPGQGQLDPVALF